MHTQRLKLLTSCLAGLWLALSGSIAAAQGVPIGALPAATTPLSGSELTILSQNGITAQTPVTNLPVFPTIANNRLLGNVSGSTAQAIGLTAAQVDTMLGLGTAAFINTGTSGALIPLLNGVNTWSGVQTYTNSDIKLLGSSTGATTFTSANSGASNFTVTVPAATDTIDLISTSQTLSNKTLASPALSGTVTGANTIPYSILQQAATNTVLGNFTSGTANVTAQNVLTCSTSASALNWTTNTGFGCNTAVNAAQLGGATFASPGPVGSTTASTGAFTTLRASTSLVVNGSTAMTSASGTGAILVTSTGAQTSGNCVTIDANGNHVASGSACGGGSVVSSIQTGSIALVSCTGTATITSVNTAKSVVFFNGTVSAVTTANVGNIMASVVLTNATTVTGTCGGTASNNPTVYFTVLAFN